MSPIWGWAVFALDRRSPYRAPQRVNGPFAELEYANDCAERNRKHRLSSGTRYAVLPVTVVCPDLPLMDEDGHP